MGVGLFARGKREVCTFYWEIMLPVGDGCVIFTGSPKCHDTSIVFLMPHNISWSVLISLRQFSTITALHIVCIAIVLCCLEDAD